jgi:predicted secreted Zn-dependent protease
LLKHEQGHFDIGLICQKEIIDQINSTVFLKPEFPGKLQSVFNSILNNYRSLSLKYDEETNHSQNQAKQSTWNDFFAGELIR